MSDLTPLAITSYEAARAAHIALAAATDGWGHIRRPGCKSRGCLIRVRVLVEHGVIDLFNRYRTDWITVPHTAALDAAAAAKEKRQNREKFQ